MSDDRSADLWKYSLAIYARPGVAEALIGLQDRLGIDVNVALCCLWRAARGHALGRRDIAAMVGASDAWQRGVVRRLRAVRRVLKSPVIADRSTAAAARRLRQKVKRIEIEAERVEQLLLSALEPQSPRRKPTKHTARRLARAALGHYVSSRGHPIAPADRAAIGHVIDAAFS